ncbi:hypothetical protein [Polluticaenibacter yanchengensis]|uniref:Uncharacterized protein n=1 Tax=Polluticaenibacter yanchengensis TaxID=3014562 RepID=A0ABT4UJA5_9BACT|nr:hypothetical protein [Chitinophagaceae bacterium LY-5]
MENKIYPEDVKLEPVNVTLYKAENGILYHESKLDKARQDNCNVRKCSICLENDTEHKWRVCDDCMHKEQLAKYKAISKTTSDYPCIIGDQYFFDQGELEEYFEENDLNPSDAIIYGCKQRSYPFLDENYYEEYTNENGELPEKLQAIINDFNMKLKDVPMLWYEDSETKFIYEP